MITVTPKNDFYDGFLIEGHAEYSPYGTDIVCAAVSVLASVFSDGMHKYGLCSINEYSGYMDVTCFMRSPATEILSETLKDGLTKIAHSYPEHVRIVENVLESEKSS